MRGARERLRAALDRLQVLRRGDALLLDQVLCTTLATRQRRGARMRVREGGGRDARKKSLRSAEKSVMSPSAVMKEETSQLELGPCFRVQVCPPSWRFWATTFPMPPILSKAGSLCGLG